MSNAEIRQQLHDYIDSAGDKKLKAIYTLLSDDLPQDYSLTIADKRELDKRYSDHQNGIGKTYSWDETIAMAKQSLTEKKNKG